MATIATMALLKPAKIMARSAPPPSTTTSGSSAAVSLRIPTKKTALSASSSSTTPAAATALAGAFFSVLATSDAAVAAQRVADVAGAADGGSGDNRGQLLLFVVAPAIGWVLYNILQPALNQLNRMRSQQAVVAGLGLGAAAGMAAAVPEASAAENLAALAAAAAAPADDSRGLLLLIVVAPAIGWVLFNILQPALNQINRMRSD